MTTNNELLESKEIELSREYTCEGRPLKTLTMREPTVRDQLALASMKGSDAQKELRMIANLCEVPPSFLESLGMKDYLKINKALKSFIGLDEETSEG